MSEVLGKKNILCIFSVSSRYEPYPSQNFDPQVEGRLASDVKQKKLRAGLQVDGGLATGVTTTTHTQEKVQAELRVDGALATRVNTTMKN